MPPCVIFTFPLNRMKREGISWLIPLLKLACKPMLQRICGLNLNFA